MMQIVKTISYNNNLSCIAQNATNSFLVVPFSLLGETLEVEDNRIVRVLEPSPYRVEPLCKYYGKCGGCSLQHIACDYQRKLKLDIVKNAFAAYKEMPPEIKIIRGEDYHYRARVQLHDGGYLLAKSHEVIQIDSCPVATNIINCYLAKTPFDARTKGKVQLFGHEAIVGENKLILCESLEQDFAISKEQFTPKYNTKESKKLALIQKRKQYRPRFCGTLNNTKSACKIRIEDKEISFDARGFFQSNIDLLPRVASIMKTYLQNANIIDIYCGCGLLSSLVQDNTKYITLVEHNRDALVYANSNIQLVAHDCYGVKAEDFVAKHIANVIKKTGAIDAIIIDPPRQGIQKLVRQYLMTKPCKYILSLSCNPTTFARDAHDLLQAGYKIDSMYMLDFFPQTPHIETLAIFHNERDKL